MSWLYTLSYNHPQQVVIKKVITYINYLSWWLSLIVCDILSVPRIFGINSYYNSSFQTLKCNLSMSLTLKIAITIYIYIYYFFCACVCEKKSLSLAHWWMKLFPFDCFQTFQILIVNLYISFTLRSLSLFGEWSHSV